MQKPKQEKIKLLKSVGKTSTVDRRPVIKTVGRQSAKSRTTDYRQS